MRRYFYRIAKMLFLYSLPFYVILSSCQKDVEPKVTNVLSLSFVGEFEETTREMLSAISLSFEGEERKPKVTVNEGQTISGRLLVGAVGEVPQMTDNIKFTAKKIEGKMYLTYKGFFTLNGYDAGKQYRMCAILNGNQPYQGSYQIGMSPYIVDETNKELQLGNEDRMLNLPYATKWTSISLNSKLETVLNSRFAPLGSLYRLSVENISADPSAELIIYSVSPPENSAYSLMASVNSSQFVTEGYPKLTATYHPYSFIPKNLPTPLSVKPGKKAKEIVLWVAKIGEGSAGLKFDFLCQSSEQGYVNKYVSVPVSSPAETGHTKFVTIKMK